MGDEGEHTEQGSSQGGAKLRWASKVSPWANIVIAVAAVVGLVLTVATMVPEDDPLEGRLDYLNGQSGDEALWTVSGNVELNEEHRGHREVVFEDNATLTLSSSLGGFRLDAHTITVGSGVKILGIGKPGRNGAPGDPGSHGARCSNGTPGQPGDAGEPGGNGVDVEVRSLNLAFLGDSVMFDLSGGNGGRGGDGGSGGKGGQASLNRDCRGGNGGQGGSGGVAANGGDGGDLTLRFQRATFNGQELSAVQVEGQHVTATVKGGKKGEPGKGGRGGRGGDGKRSSFLGSLDSEPAGNPGSLGQVGLGATDGAKGRMSIGEKDRNTSADVEP